MHSSFHVLIDSWFEHLHLFLISESIQFIYLSLVIHYQNKHITVYHRFVVPCTNRFMVCTSTFVYFEVMFLMFWSFFLFLCMFGKVFKCCNVLLAVYYFI
jgi:hypothetical protein